jgi:hypothetical protein
LVGWVGITDPQIRALIMRKPHSIAESYPGTYPSAGHDAPASQDSMPLPTGLGWCCAVDTDRGPWPVTFTFADVSTASQALPQVRRRFPMARLARVFSVR